MPRSLTAAIAALALLAAPPRAALAWDATGHMVVTSIAWSHLPAATRARLVALLAQAPADAGLASLRPAEGAPDADLMFAAYASTWPDIVRAAEPAARHAYHRAIWHFIDWYWSDGADGQPVESTTLHPDSLNIVVELERQSAIAADTARPAAERAVALAWVLHLAGDIAQPLHASSRVTPDHPDGDRGGNLFLLEPKTNLHLFWDRALSLRYPRESGEEDAAYVARVAAAVMARPLGDSTIAAMAPGDFELWARASLRTAEHEVYCCEISLGSAPPPAYLTHTDAIAEPAIHLAGLRLARLLEAILGA